MPLLLMDLDAVVAVQEKMQQTSNNLEQIVTSLNTQVQTMIGKIGFHLERNNFYLIIRLGHVCIKN